MYNDNMEVSVSNDNMEANTFHDKMEVNLKAFKKLMPVKNIHECSSRMKVIRLDTHMKT
jgi:hypothetical protein